MAPKRAATKAKGQTAIKHENESNICRSGGDEASTVVRTQRRNENVQYWQDLDQSSRHMNLTPLPKQMRSRKRNAKSTQQQETVSETYRLCTNCSRKRILLLQFPNRHPNQPYSRRHDSKPSEVRIKPKTGVVEVDIPMNTSDRFNRAKGEEYASALLLAQQQNATKAFGIAGGLGIGPARSSRLQEDAVLDHRQTAADDGAKEGGLMSKITLSGRVVPAVDGDPIYMISTFDGTTCTWTKVDAIVQLRPQFNHLDALNDLSKRPDRPLQDKVLEDRAEDVNMVIKSSADNETVDMYGGMQETAKLLRSMRDEPWQRMHWFDQETKPAKEAFKLSLSHQPQTDASYLLSDMTNEQYLDAISCPRVDSTTQGKKIVQSLGSDTQGPDTSSEAEAVNGVESTGDDSDGEALFPGGSQYETLPMGMSQPDGQTERDIERVCRLICMSPVALQKSLETKFHNFKPKTRRKRFAFLHPEHEHHAYYQWRLQRNRAGDGIDPEFDYEPPEVGR